MADQRSVTIEFGSPDFDISSVLGERTRDTLHNATEADTFIIKQRSRGSLGTATVLLAGPRLTGDQIDLVKSATTEPRAYYNGNPIFRQLPAQQNFAIQLRSGSEFVDLMLDLHNPGWGFYCGPEIYQDWNWVGHHFVAIAKAAFPDIASKSKNAVWRKGAIARLEAALDNH